MKVICKKNRISGTELKKVDQLIGKNEHRYPINIGQEFLVMGIMVPYELNYINYLVDDAIWPDWYPHFLFEITDNSLPTNWHIKLLDKELGGDIFYFTGFYELCNQDNYYEKLIDRDDEATSIYFRRKKELEEYEEEKELIELGRKG